MKELPKIDLPEEWLIGTGVNKALLSLYTNFPCRLKSEIFVLCMEGEIEASVNLNRITVRANDFVTIMPGSILQIWRTDTLFRRLLIKIHRASQFTSFGYQHPIYNDRPTGYFIKAGRSQTTGRILSILDKAI